MSVSDIPVSTNFDSSAITKGTYRPREKILDIWYTGGNRYSYFEVPIEIYEALRDAPSAGEFVNRHIKPHFRYEIEVSRRRFRPKV